MCVCVCVCVCVCLRERERVGNHLRVPTLVLVQYISSRISEENIDIGYFSAAELFPQLSSALHFGSEKLIMVEQIN